MAELTPRQQQILELIRQHIEAEGAPPTRAEIAAILGFRSPNAAESHLRALARKGVIELTPGASRGIRLGPAAGGGLPLVGRVAAGSPILAVEHIEGHYRVDPALFRPGADFLLRVSGDSMRDAGILDGDLLAVHATSEAHRGQIVVARVEEDVTVKRFYHRGNRVELHPENPDYPIIEVDLRDEAFAIEGLAVGLVRNGVPA